MRINQVCPFLFLLPVLSFIAGCSTSFTPVLTDQPEIIEGQPLSGSTYGGQQPITGAHLYILGSSTAGYGAASVSLIQSCNSSCNSSYPSHQDSSGNNYVVTGTNGSYSLVRAQYACTAGQQVYLYTVGGNPGNPGGQTNSAAGLMAILGTCISTGSGLSLVPVNGYVSENEVSTVAAAYAMAGFAVDATHVGSSGTPLAKTGIQNAFNNSANLYNIVGGAIGLALSATPAGNGTVPQAEINSLANSLAACVNSIGPTSTPCSTLLGAAKSGGTSGTNPTDTASAAINIAHNPGANVKAIYNLAGSSPPFGSPILSVAPNDWTVAITFTDDSILDILNGIAIDGEGNAWVTSTSMVSGVAIKFSPLGVPLSGSTGFSTPDMSTPSGIAIDNSGNAWIADPGGPLLEEVSSDGTTTNEYAGSGDLNNPTGIAIDPGGNIWVSQGESAPDAAFFTSGGVDLSALLTLGEITGGGLKDAIGVAIDHAGNAFFANNLTGSPYAGVSKFASSGLAAVTTAFGDNVARKEAYGVALDPSNNFWATATLTNNLLKCADSCSSQTAPTTISGGGLAHPEGIAFDGAGNAWIANNSGSISEFSNAGTAITSTTGYMGTNGYSNPNLSTLVGAQSIAVDGSGDVWVANNASGYVFEFIGGGTPVVTPIVASISGPTYTIPASKP